jgi:hypothetical protein
MATRVRLGAGLFGLYASAACGGQTTIEEVTSEPPAALFDYAPESFASETQTGVERIGYSYDGEGRLVGISKMNTLPETPRVVATLTYGARGRLERVVTDTFWGADPSWRETENRRYDLHGRLVRKEVTTESIGRNEPASVRTVSIERDVRGRQVRIIEQNANGNDEFAISYDDATGHVSSVTGPLDLLEMTFDDSRRIATESTTPHYAKGLSPSWSSYGYDPQGFISYASITYACEGLPTCTPSRANVTYALSRNDDGTPSELVKSRQDALFTNTTTIAYTNAATSVGFQQLHEDRAVPLAFVRDLYGRGEIDGVR